MISVTEKLNIFPYFTEFSLHLVCLQRTIVVEVAGLPNYKFLIVIVLIT